MQFAAKIVVVTLKMLMDILVRRGLAPRSWQAEGSRTRMSKVLRKRETGVEAAGGVFFLHFASIITEDLRWRGPQVATAIFELS